MNKRGVQWLYRELPDLVARGIVSEASADKLRDHYGPVELPRPARLAVILFGALGSLMVGAGLLLLLAHNWEAFSRPVRAGVSFLVLLLAQGLAAWVLLRRPGSRAWREGAGVLLYLMIGASISLVAQTYHISGDLPRFLLIWSLLGLAVAYVLQAATPALLYVWGVTAWACHLRMDDEWAGGYWLLLAFLAPLLVGWIRSDRYQARLTWLLWAVCLSAAIAAGVTLERVLPGLWIILYTGLFALMFLAGERWFNGVGGFWSRPLRHFGAGGQLVLSFLLTFAWPWEEIGWAQGRWHLMERPFWMLLPEVVLGGLVPLAALVMLVGAARRRETLGLLFGLAPMLAVLSFSLGSGYEHHAWAGAVFDLYLLVTGLWLMVDGLRRHQQGQMNVGLLVVATLLVFRFFDHDLSFLLRGLVFIGLGILFLVANLAMARRKGADR